MVVSDAASPGDDMALLSSLPHIVYSYGTYGLWAILLSDAKTVVYPAVIPNERRYGHHGELDAISSDFTNTHFVTISVDKIEGS